MPKTITMCSLCTKSRPEFRCVLAQLLAEFAECLVVDEVECMAACDDVPAILLDYDYHPQLTAHDLESIVRYALQHNQR